MAYAPIIIFAAVVLILLGVGMRIVWNVELENRMTEAEIESSRRCQAMLSDRVEQVRRYRHDADALLRAIERATEFGAGLFPLSQAAIELQHHRCEQVGIPFIVEAEDVSEALIACGISDSDLCLVLQNLLDNAYEASEAIESETPLPEQRSILLRVGTATDGGIVIAVTNHTVENALPSFQTGKVSPEYHGVGLNVVETIAHKYHGSLAPEFDQATCKLTMVVRLICSCSQPGYGVQ